MRTLHLSRLAVVVLLIVTGPDSVVTAHMNQPSVSADAVAIAAATTVATQGSDQRGPQVVMPFASLSSTGGQVYNNGSVAILGQPFAGVTSNSQYTMVVGAVSGLVGAGTLPQVPQPLTPPPPNDIPKNRYISFQPNNIVGQTVRLRVTMTDSLPHPGLIGSSWWVQAPVTPVPNQFPKPLLAPGECVAILGPESSAADIDWDAAGCGILHVTGCPIEPTSGYDVHAVIGTDESTPLPVPTIVRPGAKWWGDTVGLFDGTEWTGPQGIVNIDDAVASIKTFQGGQVVPPGPVPPGNVALLSVSDIEPGNINTVVNFADVQVNLLAFQGQMYPFGPADADGNCP